MTMNPILAPQHPAQDARQEPAYEQRVGGQLRSALGLLMALTLVTGALYPALVTGVAQSLWPHQANGSLLEVQGRTVGSALIGQGFDQPQYLWGRLSAGNHDGTASGGSNLGPLNPKLAEQARQRIQTLREADPANPAPIPMDLVTASGSGLDSEISPQAAQWQAGRIARARGLSLAQVQELIRTHTQDRQFGVLGEPRVNVLAVNLALDQQTSTPALHSAASH